MIPHTEANSQERSDSGYSATLLLFLLFYVSDSCGAFGLGSSNLPRSVFFLLSLVFVIRISNIFLFLKSEKN